MVRDRAGRAACHRLLERPQAPLCLGSQTAPSHPTSSRYRSNAEIRIDLADAPLRADENLRRVLLRALVTICYAHWEGYVRFAARKYLEHVALRRLQYGELDRQFIRNY